MVQKVNTVPAGTLRRPPEHTAGPLWKLIATPNDPVATVARLALGAMILPHGMQKLLGSFGGAGFEGTVASFTGMGVPYVLAVLVVIAEFFGGLGLLLGLLGRLAAFGVACVMAVAVVAVHWQNGFFMNWMGNQKGEGWEFHLLALALAAIVMIRGSGAWSADRALTRGR